MARSRKQETRVMTDSAERLANIKSIAANVDLGNGLTAAAFEAKLAETRAALEDYNSTLALADAKLNVFDAKERELRDMRERVLAAVAAKYGKDSDEYEKAGGTRKSERARPARNTTVKSTT